MDSKLRLAALEHDRPTIERRGSDDSARIALRYPRPEPCIICLEPGPQIALFYTAGRAVRLHAACEALWLQERRPSPPEQS